MGKCSTPDGASVAPTPEESQPIAGTGQTLASATDASVTVVPGVYALTACVGYALAGWATTDTAANVLFACPLARTILIVVPIGTDHLHYKVVGTGAAAYLRKVVE
jgi:hypothetical protein